MLHLKNLTVLIFCLTLFASCVYGTQELVNSKTSEAFKNIYDSSTILVSTIDGYLSAIDVISGTIKWRYNEGPILKSPRSVQRDFSYIPNPRTGELYTIVDRQLNKLPFTIPQLVTISPCKSTNGVLYSGYKKDVWIAINPDTGVHRQTAQPQDINSCPVGHTPETVFIGRTEYMIDMSDTKRLDRKWNATFVDYSSHLLPPDSEYPFQHFHSSTDGRIITFDNATKEMLWKVDLDSVIVNMYLLKKDGMHKLPSTSVGKSTYDIIEEDAATFISSEWNEGKFGTGSKSMSDNENLLQTLFIGDSKFGVYALNSCVDKQTNSDQQKTLGPLLIEGPAYTENQDPNVLQPRLPDDIELEMSVYQTTSGEFLLLGHHKVPPLLINAILNDDETLASRIPFLGYQAHGQKQKLISDESGSKNGRIEGPSNDNDFSWGEIFSQAWNKSPLAVFGFILLIISMLMLLVYFYGKHSAAVEIFSNRAESLPPSHGTRNSLNLSSSQTNSNTWEDLTNGDQHIGKLSFNTKNVLGSGCEGTKVFKGTFDGREVAVKRVISDQLKLTSREVELLRKSDTHPNVIRYYCSETDGNFFYIALQLCDCTLNDYVRDMSVRERYKTNPLEILRQATDGIVHLHSIGIVHRDLKPQNILLTLNDKGQTSAMISDFGLCKMVKYNHTSISKASGLTGTDGWIAPEVMKSDFNSLTFAVDVFSLGCIFYFVISDGRHPFGESLCRQENIRRDHYNLDHLEEIKDFVAKNAIEKMIEHEPRRRPPSHAVQNHPMFWSKEKQLQFFMEVSDRIEKEDANNKIMLCLERDFFYIFGHSWVEMICDPLKTDLNKHRSYLGHSVKDLLRAMRNKKHHYNELTPTLRQSLGAIPNEFVTYFTSRFPNLLIHTYKVMALCADESVFRSYYPDESKSFCGRVIREEIEDGFTIQINTSPKRNILKRTLESYQTPKIRSQPNMSGLNSPLNWRESQMQIASFDPTIPPPNFQQRISTPAETQKTKTRPRRRRKGQQPTEEENESVD